MAESGAASWAMPPTHLAVEHEQVGELTRLLDGGADPNETWSNMTLLLHAIDIEADGSKQTGEPLTAACTAVLLAYGADPQLPGPDGTLPLWFARRCGHELAERLLTAWAARAS